MTSKCIMNVLLRSAVCVYLCPTYVRFPRVLWRGYMTVPLDGEGATAVGSSEILRSSGCISAAENIKRCMKIMVKNWELTFFLYEYLRKSSLGY